jgi:hypothetical protein
MIQGLESYAFPFQGRLYAIVLEEVEMIIGTIETKLCPSYHTMEAETFAKLLI